LACPRPPLSEQVKKGEFKGIDPLETWIWGLSLIALTIAIHGTGVLWIALAIGSIRVRIESQNRLRLRYVPALIISLTCVVGLLLAALHGIEAALGGGILVAWRAQLAGRCNSLLNRPDQHARRFRAGAGAPLAIDGRTGGGGRYAAVRHQHGLHLHGDAELLATPHPAPGTGRGVKYRRN
jgi:hypothetical protein